MPNDEYFEHCRQTGGHTVLKEWGPLSSDKALEWTHIFLDYPPRFLGVIGMLATLDGFRHGRPAQHSSWIEAAETLAVHGISPHTYGLLRAHCSCPINSVDWSATHKKLAQNDRFSVAARAGCATLENTKSVRSMHDRFTRK